MPFAFADCLLSSAASLTSSQGSLRHQNSAEDRILALQHVGKEQEKRHHEDRRKSLLVIEEMEKALHESEDLASTASDLTKRLSLRARNNNRQPSLSMNRPGLRASSVVRKSTTTTRTPMISAHPEQQSAATAAESFAATQAYQPFKAPISALKASARISGMIQSRRDALVQNNS